MPTGKRSVSTPESIAYGNKDSLLDLHHHPGAWSWVEQEIWMSILWQEQGQVPELCQDRELEDKGQRGSKQGTNEERMFV